MRSRRTWLLALAIAIAQFASYMAVFRAEFGPAYGVRPTPPALDAAWTILNAPVMWIMVIPSNLWDLIGWKNPGPPFLLLATLNALLWGCVLASAFESLSRRRAAGKVVSGTEK